LETFLVSFNHKVYTLLALGKLKGDLTTQAKEWRVNVWERRGEELQRAMDLFAERSLQQRIHHIPDLQTNLLDQQVIFDSVLSYREDPLKEFDCLEATAERVAFDLSLGEERRRNRSWGRGSPVSRGLAIVIAIGCEEVSIVVAVVSREDSAAEILFDEKQRCEDVLSATEFFAFGSCSRGDLTEQTTISTPSKLTSATAKVEVSLSQESVVGGGGWGSRDGSV
jgi:hypothetical protein